MTGRVGVVAGVLGLFRRDRVLAVGGYDSRMATEDIDLRWRLLLAGLADGLRAARARRDAGAVGCAALWGSAYRWARRQGEVLHDHFGESIHWRNVTCGW